MIFSCNTINQPKPKGYLALNYPKSNYNQFLKQKFPFSFEYNNIAKVEEISEFAPGVIRFLCIFTMVEESFSL